MAARANLEALSLVSVVCGRIAHDLNNLLAAVDGYAEFVAQDVADRPQTLSDIQEVRSAARKGAAFSRRLRQVGQLVEWSPELLNLSQVVREAEEQVRLGVGDRVEVRVGLAEGLATVRADAQQLQLALSTMVENACEAMPDGGTLEIDTFTVGDEVAIRVVDHGRGMSPEVLGQMYDPFFSTKPKTIGNGLGMFIVGGVVDRAGGRLDVASQEGEGTSITLLLPAAKG
ncbi:MAG: sensor histidine kinase [Candidatus Dormibacteria bacterium]